MRGLRQLATDDRAIEGLPIRLVIALVVGVASLSVMMGMISGLGGVGDDELDTQVEPEVVGYDDDEVTITVVDDDGQPVEDATVLLMEDTASMNGTDNKEAQTGPNGTVTFEIDPGLSANQDKGELKIDIVAPGGYKDDRGNDPVTVVD